MFATLPQEIVGLGVLIARHNQSSHVSLSFSMHPSSCSSSSLLTLSLVLCRNVVLVRLSLQWINQEIEKDSPLLYMLQWQIGDEPKQFPLGFLKFNKISENKICTVSPSITKFRTCLVYDPLSFVGQQGMCIHGTSFYCSTVLLFTTNLRRPEKILWQRVHNTRISFSYSITIILCPILIKLSTTETRWIKAKASEAGYQFFFNCIRTPICGQLIPI